MLTSGIATFDAVHHRHHRLAEVGDHRVEPVLLAPEPQGPDPAGAGVVIDGPDVTAGTQTTITGPVDHHRGDEVVGGQFGELGRE
jgi:hypothetical protein